MAIYPTYIGADGVARVMDEKMYAKWLASQPTAKKPMAPDAPTLGDWRVALHLWGRLSDLLSRVQAMVDDENPIGGVIKERIEYSNNVYRGQLLALKDALGFSEQDVEESLWRASCVAAGDLSGVWPLPS